MLLSALSFGSGAFAASDDGYNPSAPPEPTTIDFCRLTVKADPEEGATATGGGKYKVGTGGTVRISTSAFNTEDYTYTFLYWTKNGEQYSPNQVFYYTPEAGDVEMVAHYEKTYRPYDPTPPSEPSGGTVKRKYVLTLLSDPEGCCSFNISSGDKQEEGTPISLTAYYSTEYYEFVAWKQGDDVLSTSDSFTFTMPNATAVLKAVLKERPYDPEAPREPEGHDPSVRPEPTKGDVNNDGYCSVSDLVSLIAYCHG